MPLRRLNSVALAKSDALDEGKGDREPRQRRWAGGALQRVAATGMVKAPAVPDRQIDVPDKQEPTARSAGHSRCPLPKLASPTPETRK